MYEHKAEYKFIMFITAIKKQKHFKVECKENYGAIDFILQIINLIQ